MFMVISWLTLVTIYTLSLTYLWNWSFILTYGIAAQFLDWVTVLGTRESIREIQNSKSKNHFDYIYSNMHIDATYTFIFICIYMMDENICMGALHTRIYMYTPTHLVGYYVKPFIYSLMAIHKMLNWGYTKGRSSLRYIIQHDTKNINAYKFILTIVHLIT